MKDLHTFVMMSLYKNLRLSSCSYAKALQSSSVANSSELCSKTLLIIAIAVEPNVACHVSLMHCIACGFYKYLDMQKNKLMTAKTASLCLML